MTEPTQPREGLYRIDTPTGSYYTDDPGKLENLSRAIAASESRPARPPLPAAGLLIVLGAVLGVAALAFGFTGISVLGQDCGSVFRPSIWGGLCEDARSRRLPWVIVLGVLAVGALIAAQVVHGSQQPLPAPVADRAEKQPASVMEKIVWWILGVSVLAGIVAFVATDLGQ